MNRLHSLLPLLLFTSNAVHCHRESAKGMSIDSTEHVASSDQRPNVNSAENREIRLHGSKAKLDADLFWAGDTIQVCWLNSSRDNDQERDWVRKAVNETWEYSSSLRFTGWETCTGYKKEGGNGIRIRIDDVQPFTSALGKNLDKLDTAMYLNFTFQRTAIPVNVKGKLLTAPEIENTPLAELSGSKRKEFIKAQAVHEFGHAIGFSHQQGRTDCDFTCKYHPSLDHPLADAVFYTPCDANSVMNYCNTLYLNGGHLSKFDIESVQKFYPLPGKQPDSISVAYTTDVNASAVKTIRQSKVPIAVQSSEGQRDVLAAKVYVFIAAKKKITDNISFVRYRLHQSTFDDMTSKDATNKFAILLTQVWGNFMCEPIITFRDGHTITLPGEYITVKNLDAERVSRSSNGTRRDTNSKDSNLRHHAPPRH